MHVKREIAAVIPPTKSRIQHLYIIVDILMLIICPFQNEIRVGDGVAWFSVLGWVLGKPCTSLSTFVAIISSLGERWMVCAEKKKTQEREEKKLLWLYIRDYFKSVAA